MHPSNETTSNDIPPEGGPPVLPTLPPDAGLGAILETLLKRPSLLVEAVGASGGGRVTAWLGVAAVVALAIYGVLIGSFSGGDQLVAAPVKIVLGAAFSVLICLPSLLIFASLTGADITFRSAAGILCGIVALTGMLLMGFAPVSWLFSQSTESLPFIGALHLVFWLISLSFGLRLLRIFADLMRVRSRLHLQVWTIIFLLVTVQMTTSLRPLIGTAPNWLPTEKKFFLQHWFDSMKSPENSDSPKSE